MAVQRTHVAAPRPANPSFAHRALHEARLNWMFNRYDISTTMIPGTLFTLAAWHTAAGQEQPFVATFALAFVYFWLYCTCFCMSNQIAGVEEDRHNKPERPLPSGAITLQGALVRWWLAMATFTLVGYLSGVLWWTLLWQIVLSLYNFGGWAKHWFTKNLVMALGLFAQLAAAWELVTPLTPISFTWIMVPTLVMLLHVSLQDMRDVVGDRANNRRTFPIMFGWQFSRVFLAVCFALLPLIVHAVLIAPSGPTVAALVCGAIMAVLALAIVVRLIRHAEPRHHHRTYMLFTYWYCALLASAIIVL